MLDAPDTPENDDPDAVVDRARAGDPVAWRQLYVTLSGRLLLWLRSRPSGDSAVAPEDLVMETWLVAADKIADFTGGADDFAGWLFGIARHQAANARRRSARRSTEPVDTATRHDLWGAVEDRELGGEDWVRRTLAQLPPREAEVLTLMEVVGLDTASTAQALDMNPTAVRVARHRGLGRLRRLLGGDQPALSSSRASR